MYLLPLCALGPKDDRTPCASGMSKVEAMDPKNGPLILGSLDMLRVLAFGVGGLRV